MIVVGGLFLAIFFGLFITFFPLTISVGMALAFCFCMLLWHAPWIALPFYIMAAMMLPDFKASDALTIVSIAVFLCRAYVNRQLHFPLPNNLTKPILVFALLVLISLLSGLFYFGNSLAFIYRDGRVFLYWLWFPVLYSIHSSTPEHSSRYLANVIVATGILVAAIAVLQAFTGWQLSGVGRVGDLETVGAIQSGITRVQMPGFLFVIFATLWISVASRFKEISTWLALPVLGLLAGGLIVNFGRALWLWTIISFLLSIFFVGKSKVVGYIAMLVSVLLLGLSIVVIAKPEILNTVVERVASVQQEGGRGTSYGWREWENQDGLQMLRRNPVLGVGIGGEFRNWLGALRTFEEHTRYMHNSYLFLALKIGVPGLLALLFVFWRIWSIGRRAVWSCEGMQRVSLLTCLALLPPCLGLCVTQPELMSSPGVTFFALLATLTIFLSLPQTTAPALSSSRSVAPLPRRR